MIVVINYNNLWVLVVLHPPLVVSYDLDMEICLILIFVFLLPKSSLMSIVNGNSLWLHKCESVVLLWGLWRSGVSLWKRVSVCLEMSTSAGKRLSILLTQKLHFPQEAIEAS